MTSKEIKSGPQVVADFLESLKSNNAIDANTLKAVTDLYASGKLSKTRLTQALDKARQGSLQTANKTKPADPNE